MLLTPPDPAQRPAADSLREHVVRTFNLAWPVIVARCGQLVMVTVDTIMTGQAGGTELAYLAIAYAPQIAMLVIGIGMLSGAVILVSQADGANRKHECGRILWVALLDGLILGLLWSLILFEGEALLLLTGQEADLARGGGAAMVMFAWGMPAIFLFTGASMFLEGVGRVKPGMVIMLAANIVNAGLNWYLIYGDPDVVPGGADGAVLATNLTRWIMFFAIAGYILFLMKDAGVYGIFRRVENFFGLQKRFLRLGIPMTLSYTFETTAFMSITIMAGWLGVASVAGYQAAMNVNAFCFMVAIGMSTATSVRVGNAVGRQDRKGMETAGWVGTGLIGLLMTPLACLVILFPESLASIYTNDPAVVPVIVAGLFIIFFLIVGDGLQGVLLGALRGAADIWPTTGLSFLAFWIVMVPMAWLLGHHLQGGVPGLLWAQVIGIIAAMLLFGWRFRIIARRDIRPFS